MANRLTKLRDAMRSRDLKRYAIGEVKGREGMMRRVHTVDKMASECKVNSRGAKQTYVA